MSKEIFRPVEFWEAAVMIMQDNSFFELMRSVFGKTKTPFNKQQLVADLKAFLLSEDIQKAIECYINQNDAKIIAAVSFLGEPAPGELESFFSGELNYAQLQDIIVNLEERFVLYRFNEDNVSRLALNPVLKQVLLPFAEDASVLFPEISGITAADIKTADNPPSAVCLDDRILAGLLSFVSQEEVFFKTEGVIRKRVIEEGKACFPGLDLSLVLGSLQVLGLFYATGDKLVPDKNRFDDFGSLSARERREYCASALIVYSEINGQAEILPPLFKTQIRETVDFIHCFLDSLQTPDNTAAGQYTEKSLIKLAKILKANTATAVKTSTLLEALKKTGLLTTIFPQHEKHEPLFQHGVITENKLSAKNDPVIAIDSGFSILVYPEINYADVISLASVSNIKEAGADGFDAGKSGVVRFEINKDSAVRSFDKNISADEIISLLNRLSGERVDSALIWQLKDWEKRHKEVSLKKGVVLGLSEDKRYLIETMPLADLIIETLAPGLYLLTENAMEKAAAALNGAGIDIISHPVPVKTQQNRADEKTAYVSTHKYFSPLSDSSVKFQIPLETKPRSVNLENDRAGTLSEGFHSILEKTQLDEMARAELSARIDRRLILCEAQIRDAYIRYEKLEARHLDYAGKQNIAKQACSMQQPVEIETRGQRIFGIPKSLEKEDGKLVMVIVPDGESEELRVPLAKMSLLRRIKKSIFI